jgi:hypothetical protein
MTAQPINPASHNRIAEAARKRVEDLLKSVSGGITLDTETVFKALAQ